MKKCTICKKQKLLTDFYRSKRNKDGRVGQCKSCRNKAAKEWLKANPWWEKHRYQQTKEQNRFKHLLRKYGITKDEYEHLLVQQKGRCAICNEEPKGRPLAVDHNHATDAVRGLLCGKCNRALGELRDNISLFKRAICYLKRDRGMGRKKNESTS